MSKRRTLLLLAANRRLAYRVLRSAAAVEHVERVIVLGSRAESSFCRVRSLRASRFCAGFVELQAPFADPRAAAEVNAEAARWTDPVIAPADMATTGFIAAFGSQLTTPVAPTPSLSALEVLTSKDRFAAFCQGRSLPHPTTHVVNEPEEIRVLLARRGPEELAVLKPLRGQGSVGVRIVSARDPDLRGLNYSPILVQDYVPGVDLCASAFCEQGRVEAFQAYRFRTRSVLGAERRVAVEFVEAPELQELVTRIAALTAYSGMINFDARLPPSGELKLIECNPRPWYTIQLAMLAGGNFTRLWFDEAARRRGLPPVTGSIAILPWAMFSRDVLRLGPHVRHILADASYYLAVDMWERLWGAPETV